MAITVISLISNDLFSIYAVKAVASRCAEHEIRRKRFLLQIASQCFDLFEIYCHNEYLPRTYRQYQLQVVITLIEIIEII